MLVSLISSRGVRLIDAARPSLLIEEPPFLHILFSQPRAPRFLYADRLDDMEPFVGRLFRRADESSYVEVEP